MSSQKHHFITFASRGFNPAGDRICQQAKELKFFDTIKCFREDDLNKTEWWKNHSNFILKNKRGFGLWIWKPFIILKKLREMPDNDLLLYADSGCEINKFGIDKLKEFFSLANEHGICGFQMGHKEAKFNKPELFKHLGVDNNKEITETGQLVGGILYLKKTEETVKLVEEWNQLCHIENYRFLISPPRSTHRHDQAIFSLLMKRDGRFYIKRDLTFWKNSDEGRIYPVHAMRNKSKVTKLKYK